MILAAQSMFDPCHSPEWATLAAHLGDAAPLWEAIVGSVRKQAPQLVEAWHFAGPKVGWTLRLVEKSRILVYLTPEEGRIRVGLVLGGKAVTAARASGLSAAAVSIVDNAPKYAEGHGVRFHVSSKDHMAPLDELFAIKFSAARKPPRGTRA